MVLHIQVIVMQQQKVLRNKVFIHWPTIILKSSLSVMGNTCLEIKLDMKRRQIQTTLSDRTRFKVEQYEDNSFSFYSYVKRNMLELRELHWFGKIMWMIHAGLNWNLQKEIIRSRKQM